MFAKLDVAGSESEWGQGEKETHELRFAYISGVLDLFLPLKNSGRALRSMA